MRITGRTNRMKSKTPQNQAPGVTILGIIILLLVVITTLTIGGIARYYVGKTASQKAPASREQVIKAADNYLISKVGQEKFKQYYTFEQNRSGFTDPETSKYDFVAYHFSPWKEVTDYDDIIMVQINRFDLLAAQADAVPNCIKKEDLCSFKVDKSTALGIAKNNGLGSDTFLSWNNNGNKFAQKNSLPFVLVASSCQSSKSIFIDYRNGKVLGTENSCGATD